MSTTIQEFKSYYSSPETPIMEQPSQVLQQSSSSSSVSSVIINRLRASFTDLFDFQELLSIPLQNLILRPPTDLKINTKHILSQNGINKANFVTKDQKKVMETMRIVMCCAYVLIHEERLNKVNQHNNHTNCQQEQYEEFLNQYLEDPRFQNAYNPQLPLDRKDVPYMFAFRKYVRLALELLPSRRNKGLAIQIASRLDGSNEIYVLGSGQRDSATRREVIYHTESGVPFPTRRDDDGSFDDSEQDQSGNISIDREPSPSISSKRSLDDLIAEAQQEFLSTETLIGSSSSATRRVIPRPPSLSRDNSLWLPESVDVVPESNDSKLDYDYTNEDDVHDMLLDEYHVGFTETVQYITF